MNRTQDDIRTIEKVKQIVTDKLPGFASKYFKHNLSLKTPRTLYGYALNLTSFFQYLETIGYNVKDMLLKDLEHITPQIIEDYLEYSRTHSKTTAGAKMSLSGLARRYGALSSFFDYYYKLDLIDRNPIHKVAAPRPEKNRTPIPTNSTNFEMLDFVVNGDLGGRRNEFRVHTKERDLAIIMLIMGAGLKGSDVVNLDINDINLEGNFVIVRSRKSTRTVHFSDAISLAVGQYLSKRLDVIAEHGHDNALFLSLQGKRMCLNAVQKMIKKYSSAMFNDKDYLTVMALSLSFRNNVFDKTKNIPITSAASGNDKGYLYRSYQGAVDLYECHKGKEFAIKPSSQEGNM